MCDEAVDDCLAAFSSIILNWFVKVKCLKKLDNILYTNDDVLTANQRQIIATRVLLIPPDKYVSILLVNNTCIGNIRTVRRRKLYMKT